MTGLAAEHLITWFIKGTYFRLKKRHVNNARNLF
jgi:hypothetical protein